MPDENQQNKEAIALMRQLFEFEESVTPVQMVSLILAEQADMKAKLSLLERLFR